MSDLNKDFIIRHTKAWLVRAVIGLNLCPFAKAVHVKQQIRYVVSDATHVEILFDELCTEFKHLAQCSSELTDTTLLIHPKVLNDFLDFNDFVALADLALTQLNLQGILQIASFHPQFQFINTDADEISNATNQSPYPMLHLLREDSIERATIAFPQAESIYDKNIQTMEILGVDGWEQLKKACFNEASKP